MVEVLCYGSNGALTDWWSGRQLNVVSVTVSITKEALTIPLQSDVVKKQPRDIWKLQTMTLSSDYCEERTEPLPWTWSTKVCESHYLNYFQILCIFRQKVIHVSIETVAKRYSTQGDLWWVKAKRFSNSKIFTTAQQRSRGLKTPQNVNMLCSIESILSFFDDCSSACMIYYLVTSWVY
jgi:hypothetical protein